MYEPSKNPLLKREEKKLFAPPRKRKKTIKKQTTTLKQFSHHQCTVNNSCVLLSLDVADDMGFNGFPPQKSFYTIPLFALPHKNTK